jgi:hypothetical protein
MSLLSVAASQRGGGLGRIITVQSFGDEKSSFFSVHIDTEKLIMFKNNFEFLEVYYCSYINDCFDTVALLTVMSVAL